MTAPSWPGGGWPAAAEAEHGCERRSGHGPPHKQLHRMAAGQSGISVCCTGLKWCAEAWVGVGGSGRGGRLWHNEQGALAHRIHLMWAKHSVPCAVDCRHSCC